MWIINKKDVFINTLKLSINWINQLFSTLLHILHFIIFWILRINCVLYITWEMYSLRMHSLQFMEILNNFIMKISSSFAVSLTYFLGFYTIDQSFNLSYTSDKNYFISQISLCAVNVVKVLTGDLLLGKINTRV